MSAQSSPQALSASAHNGGVARQEVLSESLSQLGGALHPGWQTLWRDFLAGSQGRALADRLDAQRQQGVRIYPPRPLRALESLGPQEVRVLILGQDPYHGPGQALGVAFGVAPGHRLPPSLRNILREVQSDLGRVPSTGPDLAHWLAQGVLLLNSCLTVEDGQAQSHSGWGWEGFTDACVQLLASQPQPMVFMLWGASAQAKAALVRQSHHLVLACNHPSPLSANRGPRPFMGCRHFSQAQAWMDRHPTCMHEKILLDW